MDELSRELAALREDLVPAWSDARGERLYAGIGQLRRRRRAQKAVSAVVVALLAGGVFYARSMPHAPTIAVAPTRGLDDENAPRLRTTPTTRSLAPAQIGGHEVMQLADGSQIRVTSSAGELAVERNEAEHIDLRLRSGVAHFDVVPNSERHFVVTAGSVEVAVVGTVFDVERAQGRVRVAVTKGKVR
ncbi:MAG TPA: FecR family protein, partial [Polyangiales bacterium]